MQTPTLRSPSIMNTPEQTTAPRRSRMSAEAVLGTGITIGALGVLFLLLGWAQAMREVHSAATILLIIGVVLLVLGALMSMAGRSAKNR